MPRSRRASSLAGAAPARRRRRSRRRAARSGCGTTTRAVADLLHAVDDDAGRPPSTPDVMIALRPRRRADLDACAAAPCCPAPTTASEYVPCTWISAFSGTTSALRARVAAAHAHAPVLARAQHAVGVGNSACSWMVPVVASTWRLSATITPRCGVDAAVGEHQLERVVARAPRRAVHLRELLLRPGEVAPVELLQALGRPCT